MKRAMMLFAVFVVVITQAQAAQQSLFSGSCGWPSAVPMWFTVVEYNSIGVPVKAHGICCDGSIWARDLMPGSPGGSGSTVNATLHGATETVVSVSADQDVDFRIVDLRTGDYVSSTYNYHAPGTLEINISTLPIGAYGVAVIQNGTIYNLLTFAK